MDAFEIWAPREIRRLRDEADVLQLALDRFNASQGVTVRKPKPVIAANPPASCDGQGKRSKYDGLYAKWAQASQEGSIDYNRMDAIALEAGIKMGRSLLRSIVHNQKQLGRVTATADGYVWKITESEAALPDQESAAS